MDSKEIKSTWKEEDGWYQNPDTSLWLKLGNRVRLGDGVSLGDCVRVGDGVSLGNDVRMGDGVSLGNDVSIISISHKYIGTLVINKDSVNIRIGCEVHPIEQWENHGAQLADKHCESEWWDTTGKHMLELLKHEAENILDRHMPK